MNTTEIFEIVQEVTGFTAVELGERQRTEPLIQARYVFLLLMIEEGYGLKVVSTHLNTPYETLRYSERKADQLLCTDRQFKAVYLKCIAKIAEKEDLECA